jgi:glutamate racemase
VVVGLFLFEVTGIAQFAVAQYQLPPAIQSVLQKDDITILITDSGLGGLSVCGGIENTIEQSKSFNHVHLIFCNALPESNYGYNNLESEEKKASVFSDALAGMVQWYHPDLILIACNTLSVVYPHTQFATSSTVPVLGIVELGAEMLYEKMKSDSSASVIIFGTETTIAANSHKKLLEDKGIAPERIISEACIDLAGEIQSDPKSDVVASMIDMYVSDAVSRVQGNHRGKMYAGFCCTHYGYCTTTFAQAFKTAGVADVEFVNPNEAMAKCIVAGSSKNKFPATELRISVVSRASLSNEEINSIGALLEHDSPKAAQALKSYEHKQDLFRFEKE